MAGRPLVEGFSGSFRTDAMRVRRGDREGRRGVEHHRLACWVFLSAKDRAYGSRVLSWISAGQRLRLCPGNAKVLGSDDKLVGVGRRPQLARAGWRAWAQLGQALFASDHPR